MATVVTLTDDQGEAIEFLVDALPRGTRGLEPAGKGDTKIEKSFSTYFDPVRRLADQLADKISEVKTKPDEVEVTIGIKLTTEAGVVFAKAGADAEMTVKLVWKNT